MDISFGFLVLFVLVLFPGLLFRRLYYYGEFSKQFNAGHNLIWLLAVCTIPGILNLIVMYSIYISVEIEIDIGEIIDKLKDINNPSVRLQNSNDIPLNELLRSKVAPFVLFLNLNSIFFGLALGRLVRITNIDTRVKLLRFKNYWFYLFNGRNTQFKKLKHLKQKNKKHLFTNADILIDSNNKTLLYSGIVVDYELDINDSTVLSKVMLQNAQRYSLREEKMLPVNIPGNLLVVDCTTMKNINLTYIYQENIDVLKSKIPNRTEVIFSSLIILLIPFFIFESDKINWNLYKSYFELPWYSMIIAYFLTSQSISVFNPFIKLNEVYQWVTWKILLVKIGLIALIGFILWLTI